MAKLVKFKMMYLNIALTVLAAAMLVVVFIYKNAKSNFQKNLIEFVSNTEEKPDWDRQQLDKLLQSKLPANIKKKIIFEETKKIKCRADFMTAAAASVRAKKEVLTISGLDFCLKNVYSTKEAAILKDVLGKIAGQVGEVEVFGLKTKTELKAIIATSSVVNKQIEKTQTIIKTFSKSENIEN